MLFNSINYFLFLISLFLVIYIIPNKFRWILLLSASIFFYVIVGSVNNIYVPVIIILSTFIFGILIEKASSSVRKKVYFLSGLFVNLSLLVFFKYINFFISTFFDLLNFIHHPILVGQVVKNSSLILRLVVPLGISYITFQAIGYLIEINRGNQISEKNPGLFATYLLFFPKLLSGPIERAHNFLPQLHQQHIFEYDKVVEGFKRILWGLFLKLVVANRIPIYTNAVFDYSEQHSGITLLIASVFYTIQMFADFAGYTQIAIGSAKILGYQLMENFDRPFIAKSVSEFWRRWHISLSSWVNEYIYNPIVTNRRNWNKWAVVSAAMITFLVLGFWHGANWTFIIFGFLQGLILSVEFFSRRFRKRVRNLIPSWLNTILGRTFVFAYFCFSLIFFRADSIKEALYFIGKIFTSSGSIYLATSADFILSLFFGIITLIALNIKREQWSVLYGKSQFFNIAGIVSIVITILLFGVFDGGQFIYVQF
jgi:alginate O-acetyltransferase complex protein AlgI